MQLLLEGFLGAPRVEFEVQTLSVEGTAAADIYPGRMKVVMDDGEQMEFGPGDFSIIPAGHDAWIVGNEPCVVIDWQGFTEYAKR